MALTRWARLAGGESENGSDDTVTGASSDQVIHSDVSTSGTTGGRLEVLKRDALSAATGIQSAVNQVIAAIAAGLFRAILLASESFFLFFRVVYCIRQREYGDWSADTDSSLARPP